MIDIRHSEIEVQLTGTDGQRVHRARMRDL